MPKYHHIPSSRSAGMTFIEVVIATAIAGVVSMGLYASAIYSARETAKSTENLYATIEATSAAARVRAGNFTKLGLPKANLAVSDYEYQFASNQVVITDPVHPGKTQTTYTLEHKFKGFGTVHSVAGTNGRTVTVANAAGTAPWQADEFKGHVLVISGGTGVNQVALIVSHTATDTNNRTVLTVTLDLTGATYPGWAVTPDTTSEILIDNGKFCELKVSWPKNTYVGSGTRSQTVFIPRTGV